MQKVGGVVQSKGGRVVVGAVIQFYLAGTTTPATMYSDAQGTRVIPAGTLKSDSEGEYGAYVANGRIDVKEYVQGRLDGEYLDVLVYDPGDIRLDSGSLVGNPGWDEVPILGSYTPFNAQSQALLNRFALLDSEQGASRVQTIQLGTGAIPRNLQDKLREYVTPQDFGAKGDNITDDAPFFQKAIAVCQAKRKRLHIPDANYCLGSALNVTVPFDITSDKTARMRWTNTASCGISLNFNGYPVGLCEVSLPQLCSPAIDSDFNIPGYGPVTFNYNLSSRVGAAVTLIGGDRTTLRAHLALGWADAFLVSPSSTRSCNNVNIDVNTIDFCVNGLRIYAGAASSLGVTSLQFRANTIWAKRPIVYDAAVGFILATSFEITGQAFVNEPGGCGIYSIGSRIDTSNGTINWLYAGFGSDSTAGVPTTLECPFIGGDGAANGLTTDGNSPDVGYFKGNFCDFTVGSVMGIPGGKGAGSVPVAGDIIRIRDGGAYNKMAVRYTNSVATSPITASTTAGEANYNGGVGGAQYSKYVYCQAAIPSLAPGASSADFYIYHQTLSPSNIKPINAFDRNEGLINQGLLMSARDTASSENRRISIKFRNISSVASAAGNYVFWVEVP